VHVYLSSLSVAGNTLWVMSCAGVAVSD